MPKRIVCNNTSNNTKVNSPGVFDHREDHTISGVINYFKSPRRSSRLKIKNEHMSDKNMPVLGVQSSVIPPAAKIAVSRSNTKTLKPGAVPSLLLHNDIIKTSNNPSTSSLVNRWVFSSPENPSSSSSHITNLETNRNPILNENRLEPGAVPSLFSHNDIINTPNIQPVILTAAVKRAISRSNKEILRLVADPFLPNDIRNTPNIQVAILPVAVKRAISRSNKKTLKPGAVPSLFLHNDIIKTSNNPSTSSLVNRWVFSSPENPSSSSSHITNLETNRNPILNENRLEPGAVPSLFSHNDC